MNTIKITPENIYDKEVVNYIINLCNKLFYNQETITSQENIFSKIRNGVRWSFLDFYGNLHKQEIDNTVENTKIVFMYQILGKHNSIEDYLKECKENTFSNTTGVHIRHASYFQKLANTIETNSQSLSYIGMTCMKEIQSCALALDYDIIEIYSNEYVKLKFFDEIKYYSSLFEKTPYSYNKDRQRELKTLADYVQCYKSNIEHSKEKHQGDPIVNTLIQQIDSNEIIELISSFLLDDSNTTAFQTREDNKNYVIFGSQVDDLTIIHEFVHALDGARFKYGTYSNKQKAQEYSDREFIAFSEIITDWFSKLMIIRRLMLDVLPMTKQTSHTSSLYSILFKDLEKFLSLYLQELKELSFTQTPINNLKELIGEDFINEIGKSCAEILNYAQRADVDYSETLSIQDLEENLSDTISSTIDKQSKFRQVLHYLTEKTTDFATLLKRTNNPTLVKLAKNLHNTTNNLNQLLQKHVAKKLAYLDKHKQETTDKNTSNYEMTND